MTVRRLTLDGRGIDGSSAVGAISATDDTDLDAPTFVRDRAIRSDAV